jgi:ABC-2 type transport system ATP-binding protein
MLKTVGLTKRYGEITALEDLNLTIPRGQVFGYVGHNGAGKTTTIRILAGLLSATSGKAIIAGTDLAGDRDRLKQLVGYMPDEFGVYDQMRVWEYLDFFGAAFKIPRRDRKKRIDEVLDITEAEYMRDRFVDTLSKGMKQKVGIARTLMHDPQLLLLDEPANGLDPRARIEQRNLIRQLADRGKTLLVSSHILPELASVCDLVGIIHQGRMQAFGPLEEVLGSIRRDRVMELKVNAGAATVADWLGKHPSCRHVDTADIKMGILHFRFSGDDAAQADLLRKLIAGNVRVASFREVPLSLEDAFMALSGMTTEDQEDAEAEDAAAPAAPSVSAPGTQVATLEPEAAPADPQGAEEPPAQ